VRCAVRIGAVMTRKIYVAHGAIHNSGDYLIFHRGWDLLERFISAEDVELVPIKRWEPITGHCDALIILGGPIVSRKMHLQSNNIKNYIEKNDVPVIPLGVGISGTGYSASEPYFIDQDSVDFWTTVYDSSRLFSVRDVHTRQVLRDYNIPAVLTGCPAFYDQEYISESSDEPGGLLKGDHHNLTITIPNVRLSSVLSTITTLFFLSYLRITFSDGERFPHRRVVFQHGFNSFGNDVIAKIARVLGFETVDGSDRSIDQITEIHDSDIHIGTRLHTNIFFLSRNKASYLLNVDNRTDAFIKTISTPSENFSFGGVKRLVDRCSNDLRDDQSQRGIKPARTQIMTLYPEMRDYLLRVRQFVNPDEPDK